MTQKRIHIEYLFLDLNTCSPCQATEAALDNAVSEITPVLEECGYEIILNKTQVMSVNHAQALQFASSPTIRINGQDIQPVISEKLCPSCSEIGGNSAIDCRVWLYNGEEHWSPPKALLMDVILRAAYSGTIQSINTPSFTHVPDNIKLFLPEKIQPAVVVPAVVHPAQQVAARQTNVVLKKTVNITGNGRT
ncbi:MAG: DUF2703 domain-containing protein [Dehalococcoidales bacterium]